MSPGPLFLLISSAIGIVGLLVLLLGIRRVRASRHAAKTDAGAKVEVEKPIEQLSREGMVIVFISTELEEVVRRSHRVAVLRDRRKVAELTGDDISEANIMNIIAGNVAADASPA
ncbi:MAG: hypothetical protein ACE5I3_02695 [Phycisphaerae bacterium]